MQAGVAGYVVKSADLSELSVAIRAIGEGRTYLSIPVRSEGLSAMLNGPAPSSSGAANARLSRREAQVLRLIALGHTYREIADQLHVSERSVETYRSRISGKLNLETRVELVRYALSSGLLQSPG
jgi:DNA-binding NarL/FixJ family response regulator